METEEETKKMPKGPKYAFKDEDIERLREALLATPPKPVAPKPLTRVDVVRSLRHEINALKERGYSRADTVNILGDLGFKISLNALTNYLSTAKQEEPGKEKGAVKAAPLSSKTKT